MPRQVLPDLRETLEESTIPYNVDVIDLKSADQRIRRAVNEEGIVWVN